jgi:hypothetical protein
MHWSAYSTFIYISPYLETIETSFNKEKVKPTVGFRYRETLLRNRKERTIDTWNNPDEPLVNDNALE